MTPIDPEQEYVVLCDSCRYASAVAGNKLSLRTGTFYVDPCERCHHQRMIAAYHEVYPKPEAPVNIRIREGSTRVCNESSPWTFGEMLWASLVASFNVYIATFGVVVLVGLCL